MDSLLGAPPFPFVYLDNILIASSTFAEHRRHLTAIFFSLFFTRMV
jgi:hypothetical protein